MRDRTCAARSALHEDECQCRDTTENAQAEPEVGLVAPNHRGEPKQYESEACSDEPYQRRPEWPTEQIEVAVPDCLKPLAERAAGAGFSASYHDHGGLELFGYGLFQMSTNDS